MDHGSAPVPADTSMLPHDSSGPRVMAIDWALAGLAALFLALRIGSKLLRRQPMWWDDCLLILSFIFLLVSCSLFSVIVHNGFGKHPYDTTLDDVVKSQPLFLIRAVFTVTAAAWSKTSFAITLHRLNIPHIKWLLLFTVISMNVALGLGCILSFVQCTPMRKSWNLTVDGTCWPIHTLNSYSTFSAAYSGFMDVVLAMIPWVTLWKLQMRSKEKIGVLLAISMGFLAGVFAFIKAAKTNTIDLTNSYTSAPFFIWDVAEVSVTIVAASIPALRFLIQKAGSSARQYYITPDNSGLSNSNSNGKSVGDKSAESSHGSRGSRAFRASLQGVSNVTISSSKKSAAPTSDDSSDRSILDLAGPVGIMYKTSITVQSANASNNESIEMSPTRPGGLHGGDRV